MELRKGQYLFGGKGDVWGDTAHIAESGSSVTLCGKPMLSTNHVRIRGIKKPGCIKCIKSLKLRNSYDAECDATEVDIY